MKIVLKILAIAVWLIMVMLVLTLGLHLISYPDTLANILGILVIALIIGLSFALMQVSKSYKD